MKTLKAYMNKISLFSANIKLFIIGSFLLSIGVNQIWLLFNLYLKSLNIHESLIGNILSLRSIGAVLIAIPASFVMLKGKVKPLLIVSSIFNTLFFIAISTTSKISIISLSIFFIGMFSTIYRVATAPFIMRNTSIEERGYIFIFFIDINLQYLKKYKNSFLVVYPQFKFYIFFSYLKMYILILYYIHFSIFYNFLN